MLKQVLSERHLHISAKAVRVSAPSPSSTEHTAITSFPDTSESQATREMDSDAQFLTVHKTGAKMVGGKGSERSWIGCGRGATNPLISPHTHQHHRYSLSTLLHIACPPSPLAGWLSRTGKWRSGGGWVLSVLLGWYVSLFMTFSYLWLCAIHPSYIHPRLNP